MRAWSIVIVAVFLSPLVGQRALIVDATGATTGSFKSITAALAVAKYGDIIRVKKGTYLENIALNARAISIMGIAPNIGDVVLMAATAQPALLITNHPSGRISRFSRFVVQNAAPITSAAHSVQVSGSGLGDIVFEFVHSNCPVSIAGHQGVVVLTACNISAYRSASVGGGYLLSIDKVSNAFIHDCDLRPLYRNSVSFVAIVYPSTVFTNSTVELSHSRLSGTLYGSYTILYSAGGPALRMTNSKVRLTGLAADSIIGGNGHVSSLRPTAGGSGIEINGGRLEYSGVTVRQGAGVGVWQIPVPPIRNTGGSVVLVTPKHPVVAPLSGFARGKQTKFGVFGTPSASSLTWIAVDYRPISTPWGTLVIDATKPALPYTGVIPASGSLSFNLDLRPLPATFVGIQYAMQTITLDTSNRLAISAPRIGVVGY